MIELVRAVLYLGENKLEVYAKDKDSASNVEKVRRVAITWMKKVSSDSPPDDWAAQVKGECDFQRGVEWERASGKVRF